ncbi:MAG TPA: hypothetical protein HPP66_07920, partial [Planctomycetes bacterium]|nr:hypothetical protein [Planctomycetota bacterium]
ENQTLAHFRHFSSLFTNFSSTTVVSALQIAHFMQNKPNFQNAQMNVNKVLSKDYENKTLGERGKNKPNSNPIQTQSNPIKANKMPKQSQYKPKTNPICSELVEPISKAKNMLGRTEPTKRMRNFRANLLPEPFRLPSCLHISVFEYRNIGRLSRVRHARCGTDGGRNLSLYSRVSGGHSSCPERSEASSGNR